MAMANGYIKNVVSEKGYGFIACRGGDDLFFHAKDIEPGLDFDEQLKNLRVEFDIASGPDGRSRARNVRRAD